MTQALISSQHLYVQCRWFIYYLVSDILCLRRRIDDLKYMVTLTACPPLLLPPWTDHQHNFHCALKRKCTKLSVPLLLREPFHSCFTMLKSLVYTNRPVSATLSSCHRSSFKGEMKVFGLLKGGFANMGQK